MGTHMVSPYKALSILGKPFVRISHMKNCTDLNLGEDLRIFISFHFSDSKLYLSNGFDLKWRDIENQQSHETESDMKIMRSTMRSWSG